MFKKKSLQDAFLKIKDVPGVYFFKGLDDAVLYIGKAKSLKKRVANYQASSNEKIAQMVDIATALHVIETKNELDALVLEAQMIQNHQPPFNVVYRGGRPFLNLVITKGSKNALPELVLSREVSPGGLVVGRFLQKSLARAIYGALLKAFSLRICKTKISGGCLYWHMGQCAGLCREDFDAASYKMRLKALGEVLTSGLDKYWRSVEKKIKEACGKLEYEKARSLTKHLELFGQCRDVLNNSWASDQAHLVCQPDQRDVWLLWPNFSGLQLLSIINGHVQKRALWLHPDQEISQYITVYYSSNPIPLSIFTDFEIDERELLQGFLTIFRDSRVSSGDFGLSVDKKKSSVSVIFDKVGNSCSDQVGLAKIVGQASYQAFLKTPLVLAKMVGASTPVKTIDCFDVSHKQGHWIVASCVRFVDGREDVSGLRYFKIRGLEHSDDYASLLQAVSRRYSSDPYPDLVLIDGGKGQLSSVSPALAGVAVAALAKREERLFCNQNMTTGIKLDVSSPEGALLIQLRDRTHACAVGYHSKLFNSSFFD